MVRKTLMLLPPALPYAICVTWTNPVLSQSILLHLKIRNSHLQSTSLEGSNDLMCAKVHEEEIEFKDMHTS